jgi:antitoxin CptB
MKEKSLTNFSALKWKCRRGMLELDLLLDIFLTEAYEKLPENQQKAFENLLEYPDPEIFAFLMGHEEPVAEPKEITEIIEVIRQHVKSRFSA